MKTCLDLCRTIAMCAVLSGAAIQAPAAAPLGLPPVPIPAAQPKLPPKIALGDRLFHDERFSSDGKVSCLTCHEEDKAVTDHRQVPCSHEVCSAPGASRRCDLRGNSVLTRGALQFHLRGNLLGISSA